MWFTTVMTHKPQADTGIRCSLETRYLLEGMWRGHRERANEDILQELVKKSNDD